MHRLTCPCCHEPERLETRFDVKSRPYLTCVSCSVRIFPRGASSIVGLALLSPIADSLAARIKNDRAEWERSQETRRRVEESLTRAPANAPANATAADLTAPLVAAGGRS